MTERELEAIEKYPTVLVKLTAEVRRLRGVLQGIINVASWNNAEGLAEIERIATEALKG